MYWIFLYVVNYFLLPKTQVTLHLEQINPYLIHTGISFKRGMKTIRFDYRSFNDNGNYITTRKSRQNFQQIFPDLPLSLQHPEYQDYQKNIHKFKKDIIWGYTNYSLAEILEYEKLLQRRYIVGIYDCRHYTNKLAIWCLDKSIPIWNLKSLM